MANNKNQGNELVELIAVSGEFPADAVHRLGGGGKYKLNLITKLKKSGVIKTHYRDKLRGFRLTAKTKQTLLTDKPERFRFYLTGNSDTNLIQSDIARRLRLHRIANALVTMYNADVKIFRDEKPEAFNSQNIHGIKIDEPCFYSSREFKEIDSEMAKAKNARAVGILLTRTDIFIVYNTENYAMKWDGNAESAVKAIIIHYLCYSRMQKQYSATQPIIGLLFGNNMEMLYQVMSGGEKQKRSYFLFDGTFDRFIFLTNDRYGEVLLKLLCDNKLRTEFDDYLRQELELNPANKNSSIENDSIGENGTSVLFSYLIDMPRLARFCLGLKAHKRRGTVVCFDFQEEILVKYCGELVDFETVDFTAFEQVFFPQD